MSAGLSSVLPQGDSRQAAAARLRVLATAQRELAVTLHAEVGRAVNLTGLTWDQAGTALGIPRETAFRQFHGGTTIVVARAHQARRKPAAP